MISATSFAVNWLPSALLRARSRLPWYAYYPTSHSASPGLASLVPRRPHTLPQSFHSNYALQVLLAISL
ncbi:hypothetical protein K523DRAFT_133544 [Schizophyllum commune Tattone D]|nr:hypothetical protein K523DRAFT_133544 [Schizophyllum commune Tattone D]